MTQRFHRIALRVIHLIPGQMTHDYCFDGGTVLYLTTNELIKLDAKRRAYLTKKGLDLLKAHQMHRFGHELYQLSEEAIEDNKTFLYMLNKMNFIEDPHDYRNPYLGVEDHEND